MKAREIMTPDPQAVTGEDPVSRAAQIMRDLNVGIVPVVEDGASRRLRGVITDRDLAVRHVAEGHTDDCRVLHHMSEQLTTTRPEDDVDRVTQIMKRDQVRRIPVVDDGERLVGIIAQADVAVEVGPREPGRVEEALENISRPAKPDR